MSRSDPEVGETVTSRDALTTEAVRLFARLPGEPNRLHRDDAFAAWTRFEGRISHGMGLSGLISAAIARLPGLPISLQQDLEFLAPVSRKAADGRLRDR